jgi:hypothetical protein
MAAPKALAGLAVLVLGAGIRASVATALSPCGHRACSDEVAASGFSGQARGACVQQLIADCRAGLCSCTGGSPPCSCVCGDGLCGPSEDCSTCPQDCCTTPFCSGAGDCPIGTACNTMTGQCESACGDASHSICHGGCCGGGTCQPGTVASACGSGGACAVCDATNQSGSACVSGHCGCTSEEDCPAASGQSGAAPVCSPAPTSAPRSATRRMSPRVTAAAARRRSTGLASPAPRTRRAGTRGRAWTARTPSPAA